MSSIVLIRWFKNISLTRKLYFVVSIMAVLIAVELFTLSFMIHTLSSTRALVGGESIWSKAEKDAAYSLTKYGYTHDEKSYEQYMNLLAIPLGDREARKEMLKPKPSNQVVYQGFLQGHINADDIDGVMKLLQRFHNISYIKKAVAIWSQGDANIEQLQYLGNRLHNQVTAAKPDEAQIEQTLYEIYILNESLTLLENEFSYTLGEGSRWVEHMILGVLFIIAITVEFSGLFLTISVSRAISKGINEIVDVAGRVSRYDFSSKARIFSSDEIGQLATSFNRMIDELKKRMNDEKAAKDALHAQRDLYETMITAQSEMGEGVCIVENEQLIYVNDALCKMYGYNRGELLKMSSFFELVPDKEKQKLAERFKLRHAGERSQSSGETKIMRKDGEIIDIEYTVSDLSSGNRQRMISIIRDVTEKNMAAELLRREKARAESAEISKKVGEQFLANMSHEIRTPMNAILGFTDILVKTPLSAEQKEYLEAIKISGDNLLVIINDILDFSRIRSGKMPIERKDFKLSKIISVSIDLMQPKAKEKKLKLEAKIDNGIPDNLIGDDTRLMQVMLNLIANAVKFTSKGEIILHVSKIEESKGNIKLQFQVKDTGIGIPEDQLETIFDAFRQVNNQTARQYGGTGLGLAIVKQLAEIQGGSVSVTSTPGEGSCFNFIIGYGVNEKPLIGEQDKIDEQAIIKKKLHILVAEDNVMNQVLTRKVLSDWGWSVEIAENGEKAIELLRRKNFDVILMDIQLPEMDGYEATQYIRTNLKSPKNTIPIIAMTACVMESEQEKCFKVGMNGYVSKPFNVDVLYSNISKAIKRPHVSIV